MNVSPILLSSFPIISTFLGGYVVYRWKKDLHPWLSLSGGILLGVAFLDLLPEALEQGTIAHLDHLTILSGTLASILLFHLIDKGFAFHSHHEHAHGEPTEFCENTKHQRSATWMRAGGMIFHSFLDGIVIGGGFATDFNLGLLVTLAVITHDFSDGMSTVTILKAGLGDKQKSILPLLALDAIAPFIGALIGLQLALSAGVLAMLLAMFAGFFIFLSLSELLPQAHAGEKPRRFGLVLTVLGILAVVFIRSFSNL
jgi:ZIP family zinc transporter